MQTDVIRHNIVGRAMLGGVGTYCVVHANERNNCQHWRSSKEAMHSGTVILPRLRLFVKIRLQCACACADVFMRPTLLWLHANGCNIVALRFAFHKTKEMLGLVARPVSNYMQQSANIVGVPCKRTQHVGPNNVACCWQTILHPFGWTVHSCSIFKSN